jgi:hypothetical protein
MSKASKIIDKVLESYGDDGLDGQNMPSINVEDADDAKSPSEEDAAKNQFPLEKDEDAVFPVDDKDVELKKLPPGIKYEDELDLPGEEKKDEEPKNETASEDAAFDRAIDLCKKEGKYDPKLSKADNVLAVKSKISPEDWKLIQHNQAGMGNFYKNEDNSFGGFDKEGMNQLIQKAIHNAVDQVIKTNWAELYPVELKALPPGVKTEDAPDEIGLPTLVKKPEEDDKKEDDKKNEDGEEMGLPFAGEEDEDDEMSLPKAKDEEACFPVDDHDVELKKLPPGIKYEDDEACSPTEEDPAKHQFPAKSDEEVDCEGGEDEQGDDAKAKNQFPMQGNESAKWDAMVAKLKKEGYGDKAAARISGYIKARKGK